VHKTIGLPDNTVSSYLFYSNKNKYKNKKNNLLDYKSIPKLNKFYELVINYEANAQILKNVGPPK